MMMLAGFILSIFFLFQKFSQCRSDFLFLYITVNVIYFFFMPYKLKKGLESYYINTIQSVYYYVLK